MKNRFNFVIGFILGAVIFGSTAALATGVIANRTTSKVLVNGAEISAEAYNINGNNYFKLRDIGLALDFAVVWDGANGRILIDTSRGYVPNEALPTTNPAETQAPAQTSAPSIEEMKAEIIRLTNAERARIGLPELAVLPALMDTAQAKADDMINNHYYGHESPVYGTPGEMIKAAVPSAKSCAENQAPWTRTPEEAFAGWAESAAHMNNMVNPKYTHIGVGIVEGADGGYWWVQHFVSI